VRESIITREHTITQEHNITQERECISQERVISRELIHLTGEITSHEREYISRERESTSHRRDYSTSRQSEYTSCDYIFSSWEHLTREISSRILISLVKSELYDPERCNIQIDGRVRTLNLILRRKGKNRRWLFSFTIEGSLVRLSRAVE